MKQSRKDFIKKAHENACSEWKTNIEKEFPKLFKEGDLVVGKWYKIGGNLYNVMSVVDSIWCLCYGFDSDGWLYESKRCINNLFSFRPATDEEVGQSLIKEANKRGFKLDVDFKFIKGGVNYSGLRKIAKVGSTFKYKNGILQTLGYGEWTIFNNGKWAEIIKETITKEQAEKELGKTIIN